MEQFDQSAVYDFQGTTILVTNMDAKTEKEINKSIEAFVKKNKIGLENANRIQSILAANKKMEQRIKELEKTVKDLNNLVKAVDKTNSRLDNTTMALWKGRASTMGRLDALEKKVGK